MALTWKLSKLTSRAILALRGLDSQNLLQGLVTNDMGHLNHATSMYAFLLNIKGRVVCDLLMYSTNHEDIFVECDQSLANTLLHTFKKYKIRKKVAMSLTDMVPWSVFDPKTSAPDGKEMRLVMDNGFPDPRSSHMGVRLLDTSNITNLAGLEEVPESAYTTHRYRLGIPEGVTDIPTESALPLECNLAFLNGVSFTKGCYVGQELTARTQHTGVIRKRLMPVRLSKLSAPAAANPGDELLDESGRAVGRLRGLQGQHGLALVRVAAANQTLRLAKDDSVTLTASVPEWWPEGVMDTR